MLEDYRTVGKIKQEHGLLMTLDSNDAYYNYDYYAQWQLKVYKILFSGQLSVYNPSFWSLYRAPNFH